MTTLLFNKKEVEALLSGLKPKAEVMLVGDQGIYLMSFTQPVGSRTIVYAIGTDPSKDDDWWDTKRALFGGDDGGDVVGDAKALSIIAKRCKRHLVVRLTETQIEVTSDK